MDTPTRTHRVSELERRSRRADAVAALRRLQARALAWGYPDDPARIDNRMARACARASRLRRLCRDADLN